MNHQIDSSVKVRLIQSGLKFQSNQIQILNQVNSDLSPLILFEVGTVHNACQPMNPRQQKEISDCTGAIAEIRTLLDREGFCEPFDAHLLMESFSDLRQDIGRKTSGLLFGIGLTSRHLKDIGREFTDLYDSLPGLVHRHNAELAATLAVSIGKEINPVEGYDLDRQQLTAIATDVRNRLIIAGAGTGKTTTIVGLAKYLFSSGKASPEDVLFLSFTNNSVDDLKKRIESEIGCRADVTTFHRLGMRIIAQSGGIMPKVSRMDVRAFVRDQITKGMSDPRYMAMLNEYLVRDCRYSGDESDFGSSEEGALLRGDRHIGEFAELLDERPQLLAKFGDIHVSGVAPVVDRNGEFAHLSVGTDLGEKLLNAAAEQGHRAGFDRDAAKSFSAGIEELQIPRQLLLQ